MWDQHIEQYAARNDKDPSRVEGILIRGGWEPAQYHASMKSELFDYLDDWYTLSIKTLPTPATQNRRNPSPYFYEDDLEDYYYDDYDINDPLLNPFDDLGGW